ncbi:MAG: hypothetical protein MRY64_15010 [Hyphomonadaceae bacterium]|nr:hypothetical protein [Hyphomonadaceae bacterium]
MNLLVFIFAALVLVCAHLLRAARPTGRMGGVVAFVFGLTVSVVAVKLAVASMGLGRTTDFDRVVNHAAALAEAEPEAPLIVFTGASYSRNAIDDVALTAQLRAAGYPHRVINLSLEAASLAEREAHLDAFLLRVGRAPDMVFIEVAANFDHRPAQFFNNSKFSLRAIEQFDLRTSAWTGLGLMQGGCEGAGDCAKQAGLTGTHFGLNALNIGLVARGARPEEAGELSAYDPQFMPREPMEVDDRLGGLRAGPNYSPRPGPLWIASMRRQLDARLAERGVRETGYYFPPVIDAHERAYMDGLCLGELSHAPCLAPTDPALLAALEGDVWFDDSHLLAHGAEIYTRWLGEELAGLGLLGGGHRFDLSEKASAP